MADLISRLVGDFDWLRGVTHAETFHPAELRGTYPSQVYGSADGEVVASVDPDDSAQPIQDAVDATRAEGGGLVTVPDQRVVHDGDLEITSGVAVVARRDGRYGSAGEKPVDVEFTAGNGVVFTGDANGQCRGVVIDGWRALGQGEAQHASDAFRVANGVQPFNSLLRLYAANFGGQGFNGQNGGIMVQCRFPEVHFNQCDPGGDPLFYPQLGEGNSAGALYLYPSAVSSGVDSPAARLENGTIVAQEMNCGRATREALVSTARQLDVRRINVEPNSQQSATTNAVDVRGLGTAEIGQVVHRAGTFDYIYRLQADSGGDVESKMLGPVDLRGGTLNTNRVAVDGQTVAGEPSRYRGLTADVDNNTGAALNEPVYCLDGTVS